MDASAKCASSINRHVFSPIESGRTVSTGSSTGEGRVVHFGTGDGLRRSGAASRCSRTQRPCRENYEANALGWEKSRDWLRQLDPAPLIACWKSLTEADYREVLAHIRIPALLIYGGESNFYRTETAYFVRDCIPQALLHIYEGTDPLPPVAKGTVRARPAQVLGGSFPAVAPATAIRNRP